MSESNKFIIPQKNFGIIAECNNNIIKETGKIDIPYSSKSVFLKNRLIVSICFGSKPKSKRLKVFDEHGKQLSKRTEYKFESINFKENTVYLGGQYRNKEKELFSYIDFTDIGFDTREVEIPVKTVMGKTIDDILIRGDILYLVDNVVYPKYIFKYDISAANNPRHIETCKLENNGTYENIIKGDINENWIVLFSSSVGRCGAKQHISIIGKEEQWNKQNCLTFLTGKSYSDSHEFSRVLDICVIQGKLLILKENSLCFIDLENRIAEENITQINDNNEKYNKILKVDNDCCILLNEEKYELFNCTYFRRNSFKNSALKQ